MGLLGEKESKEEKRERKFQELVEKYGLEDLTDPQDIKAIKEIGDTLLGNRLIELGLAFQGNAPDSAKMTYFRVLMEQNFIIIRQLNRIINKL